MASVTKLINQTTGLQQLDGVALTVIPDSGTIASNPITGLVLEAGMQILATLGTSTAGITNANSEGTYNVGGTAPNYTLTLVESLATASTYNNGSPTLFKIAQGTNHNTYEWSKDSTGVVSFTNLTPSTSTSQGGTIASGYATDTNGNLNKWVVSTPQTINSGQSLDVTFTFNATTPFGDGSKLVFDGLDLFSATVGASPLTATRKSITVNTGVATAVVYTIYNGSSANLTDIIATMNVSQKNL
jgi:hypothetical protein